MRHVIFFLAIIIFLSQARVFAQKPSIIRPTRSATINPGKSRLCEALSNTMTKRVDNMTHTTTVLQEKFDSISQRVQDYYQTKLVPDGKTLASYSAFITTIETKKTGVQTTLDELRTFETNFTCDQNKPSLSMRAFKDKMKALLDAVKEYKTSIRDLIVAVHTLGSNGKPLRSISVNPTITPVALESITPTIDASASPTITPVTTTTQ